ncbi:glycine zipper 2TM domain-containing protein [Citrobacter amalonaticus]|nr:glycine zipper 2TM domain-containing protein [Citrobacter amalonaticus]
MLRNLFLIMAGVIILSGCTSKPIGSANNVSTSLTGQAMRLSQGTITSVREITIQDDSSSNVTGTVGGAVIGGLAGNSVGGGSGRRLATASGAVAGAMTGQALQRNMARQRAFELFVKPDTGHEFAIVQPAGSRDFFVGQRVNITSQRGQVLITPM